MRLKYMGTYDLNPDSLPADPHPPGAVPFREFKDLKTFSLFANALSLLILIPLSLLLLWRSDRIDILQVLWGCVLAMVGIVPHEILHTLFFKGDVYLYTNLRQGMLFVIGTESMSKGRFIVMSMLPSLVLGFIPYFAAMIQPSMTGLGVFGMMSIMMGAGDFYNVFNAATQMPRGSRAYMHRLNSYWFMPGE